MAQALTDDSRVDTELQLGRGLRVAQVVPAVAETIKFGLLYGRSPYAAIPVRRVQWRAQSAVGLGRPPTRSGPHTPSGCLKRYEELGNDDFDAV